MLFLGRLGMSWFNSNQVNIGRVNIRVTEFFEFGSNSDLHEYGSGWLGSWYKFSIDY